VPSKSVAISLMDINTPPFFKYRAYYSKFLPYAQRKAGKSAILVDETKKLCFN